MRTPLITTLLAVALAPFAALPLAALERAEARHLLARTGFSPTPGEIEPLLPLTREQAVDAILASTRTSPRTAIPDWATGTLPQWNAKRADEEAQIKRLSSEKERMDKGNEFRGIRYKQGDELKAWWYGEMIATDSPLTERMTLFWSNHFTSSMRGVEDPRLIYEQHANLRKGALDNFAFLLKDINTDPAMYYYLDSNSNTAGRPNENYAREVMELFTLGEGVKYTEADIKEVARAFTGYKIDDKTGRAAMTENAHDAGWKNILGKKGSFTGDEVVIELLRSEEQVALYVTEKIWKEFVSDSSDPKEIRKLAGLFYRGKYDIKKLLRAAFLSDKFWDPANRGTLFKSPVEMLVGAARALQLPADNTSAQGNVGVSLGLKTEKSLYHVLVMGLSPKDAAVNVRPNLDVLPSNETLAAAELYLAGRQNRDRVLRDRLANVSADYDVVILDCSPSLSLLNQNALVFAEGILVPVACDFLSLVGVRQVIKTVKSVNSILHHPVQIWGVLPTFFDSRARICRDAVDTLQQHFGDRCLSPIRQATRLKEAPAQGKTIFEHAADSNAAEDYTRVVDALVHGHVAKRALDTNDAAAVSA